MTYILSNMSSKNILEIIMVWGLIIGTLVSYVPQYYRLYKIKDTKGISESMLIFGIFSSYTNVLGSIQENLTNLIRCNGYGCYDYYIPIVQLFSPCLCALIFYSFYLYYFYYEKNIISKFYSKKQDKNVKYRAWGSVALSIAIFIYFILINIYETYNFIDNSGKVLNIISTVLSLVMWLPQIYTTYRLKNNHSLSLIALSIHAFGCLTTVIYQSIFLKQPFWVILCYIVGFISETSIVIMCIYYRRKKPKITNPLLHNIINETS